MGSALLPEERFTALPGQSSPALFLLRLLLLCRLITHFRGDFTLQLAVSLDHLFHPQPLLPQFGTATGKPTSWMLRFTSLPCPELPLPPQTGWRAGQGWSPAARPVLWKQLKAGEKTSGFHTR